MTHDEWKNRIKSELPDFVTAIDQATDADVALWIHRDDLVPENDDQAALFFHALLFALDNDIPIGMWKTFKDASGGKWVATKENGKLFKLARIFDVVNSSMFRCNKIKNDVIVQS